jgi:RNA polymerase sigma-70 factor (ECF subfamily)
VNPPGICTPEDTERSPEPSTAAAEKQRSSARERLRRALDGDEQALRAVLAELVPIVRATTVRELVRQSHQPAARARQEAEDLVQDLLLALFGGHPSKLDGWDPERGSSLASYVRLLTRHHVADVLRRRRKNPFTDRPTEPGQLAAELAAGPDPERSLALRRELRATVDHARSCLSARGFDMFRRLWLEAEPTCAICAATGQKPATVYQWRRRIQVFLIASAAKREATWLLIP